VPLVIDKRLQACTDAELRKLMRELSDAWQAKGCPSWSDMPRVMLGEYERLATEFYRRGVQLHLFD